MNSCSFEGVSNVLLDTVCRVEDSTSFPYEDCLGFFLRLSNVSRKTGHDVTLCNRKRVTFAQGKHVTTV